MSSGRRPAAREAHGASHRAGDDDVPPQPGAARGGMHRWSAKAQRILTAARSLLQRSAVGTLSMDAIAREAGVDKRAIFYYFQTKAGLLAALIEWYLGDGVDEMRRFIASLPQGEERLAAVADGHQDMLTGPAARQAYLVYLDIAVHMLRTPDGRARLAGALATYRQLNAWGIAGETAESEDVRALSALTLALSDGLALQALAEPGAVDTQRIWLLWQKLAEMVTREAG